MELPCDTEGHHAMPAPGEPGRAVVLVTAVGPQGQGLESLRGGLRWAAHGGPYRWPECQSVVLSARRMG
eukprot:3263564-Alexandrium_andersonii.AAC.1